MLTITVLIPISTPCHAHAMSMHATCRGCARQQTSHVRLGPDDDDDAATTGGSAGAAADVGRGGEAARARLRPRM